MTDDVREDGPAAAPTVAESQTEQVVTTAADAPSASLDDGHGARTDGASDGPSDADAPDPASAYVDGDQPEDGDIGDQDSGDDETDDEEPDGDSADVADNPLETEAEIAADYLEELLDIADLDGDIDTYIEGDRAHVSVITDADTLVGRNGEVLDALQELTRLAVMTETGERSRLMLDVAGYRDRRRRELLEVASTAVADAKDSGERVTLSPMNPFERKVVHDAVAGAGLTSESEGEEPNRRVVVIP